MAHTSLFLSILNDIFAGEEENWMKQVTSPSVRHIYLSMYLHWSLFLFFFPRGEHHPTRIIFRRGRRAALLAWSSIWFLRLWRWPRYKLYGSVVILFWPLVNFFVTLAQSELVCSRIEQVRVISNWLSKVIWICFGFALLRSVIGVKTGAMLWTNQTPNEN